MPTFDKATSEGSERMLTRRRLLSLAATAVFITPVTAQDTVPPMSTALRCSARKSPFERSRTSASLIGVLSKANPSMSLPNGSLAMVIWYLIDRACFSAISAVSGSPTMRGGSC
jgi:hypothetical protein